MTVAVVLVALALEVACVVLARRVAQAKGRAPGNWGLAAILIGPVALLAVLVVPRRNVGPRS